MKNVITFDKEAKKQILEFFDKTTDQEGYIVEKDNPSQKVLSADGQPLTLQEFAGIRKGSEIYIKSDFNSLIDVADLMN